MASSVKPVILLIDSDPVSLLGIAATLHAEQCDVHCAQDIGAALMAASQYSLDLVICDVDVDGLNGLEIVSQINDLPDCGDIPALFLSSTQMADVVSRRFRSGSALFLRRPFAPKLLIDLVDKALWMPHLVKSHIHKPHINLGGSVNTSASVSSSKTP